LVGAARGSRFVRASLDIGIGNPKLKGAAVGQQKRRDVGTLWHDQMTEVGPAKIILQPGVGPLGVILVPGLQRPAELLAGEAKNDAETAVS
jgi:hypothetical protein